MPKTTQSKSNPIAAAETSASRALARLGRLQVNVEQKAAKRTNKIKFLLGAGLEVMMKRDQRLKAQVKSFMAGFLTRGSDIAVFAVGTDEDYFEHLVADDAEEEAALTLLRDPGTASSSASKDSAAYRPFKPEVSAVPAAAAAGTGSASGPRSPAAPASAART